MLAGNRRVESGDVLGARMLRDGVASTRIERLDEFFASFDVARRLGQIIDPGERHQLEPICRMAVHDACNLTNPQPATWEDYLRICEEVW